MFGNLFNNKTNLTLLLLSIFLLIIDQGTKVIIVNRFDLYESIPIVPFLNLTFVVNYGFAFGFFKQSLFKSIIVSVVILSIIVYFLYLLIKTQDQIFKMCLVLILSGAVGNFIDRIFRGYVVDLLIFMYLTIIGRHLISADSCISVGFVILIFNILF